MTPKTVARKQKEQFFRESYKDRVYHKMRVKAMLKEVSDREKRVLAMLESN